MTPHRRGGLAAGGSPTDPRKWDVIPSDRSPGLWITALRPPSQGVASVADGRLLPTHSCATAPDLHRLPRIRELFDCAVHYGLSLRGMRRRVGRLLTLRNARLIEGRHVVEDANSSLDKEQREHRAGAFSQAKVQVEQWRQT